MTAPDDLPTLLFAGPADFEAWLERHHVEPDGIWLQIARKGAPEPSASPRGVRVRAGRRSTARKPKR